MEALLCQVEVADCCFSSNLKNESAVKGESYTIHFSQREANICCIFLVYMFVSVHQCVYRPPAGCGVSLSLATNVS